MGSKAGRFISVLYHDVHPGATFDYGTLPPSASMYHIPQATFERHVQLFADHPEREVVICFDDGWHGAVTVAAPILERAGVPAYFFITTGFIGKKNFATADDLRRLDPRRFTIGSHGVTHRMLNALPTAEIRAELADSRRQLEDLLGRAVDTVSIPGGAVDQRVRDSAREAGYTDVFTSTIGVNPTARGRFDIARMGVTKATTDRDIQRWLAFRLGREWWRKAALNLPKRVLGMHRYSKLRRALLGDRTKAYEPLFEP